LKTDDVVFALLLGQPWGLYYASAMREPMTGETVCFILVYWEYAQSRW